MLPRVPVLTEQAEARGGAAVLQVAGVAQTLCRQLPPGLQQGH